MGGITKNKAKKANTNRTFNYYMYCFLKQVVTN